MRFFFKQICLAACCFAVGLAAQSAQARVVEGNVIMDQPMRENLCALTFDDGPSINTPHLLDMLDSSALRALIAARRWKRELTRLEKARK